MSIASLYYYISEMANYQRTECPDSGAMTRSTRSDEMRNLLYTYNTIFMKNSLRMQLL